jgi:hypothetical protein
MKHLIAFNIMGGEKQQFSIGLAMPNRDQQTRSSAINYEPLPKFS